MSAPQQHPHPEADAAESIVGVIPWVLPVSGALLMFLMAFIAVFMA